MDINSPEILGNPNAIIFFMFSLLDNYLNPNYKGAKSEEMYNIFIKMTEDVIKYKKDEKSGYLNQFLTQNNGIIEFMDEKLLPILKNKANDRFEIHLISVDQHAIKFIADKEKNEATIINSGYGMEHGNNNICYSKKYNSLNDLQDVIKKIKELKNISISRITDFYNEIKKNVIEIDNNPEEIKYKEKLNVLNTDLCKSQQSGSCTFYSTKYLIYFIIFKLFCENDQFIPICNHFSELLEKYSITKLLELEPNYFNNYIVSEGEKIINYRLEYFKLNYNPILFDFVQGLKLINEIYSDVSFDYILSKINIQKIKIKNYQEIGDDIILNNIKYKRKYFFDKYLYFNQKNISIDKYREQILIKTYNSYDDVCPIHFLIYCWKMINDDLYPYSECLNILNRINYYDNNNFDILLYHSCFLLVKIFEKIQTIENREYMMNTDYEAREIYKNNLQKNKREKMKPFIGFIFILVFKFIDKNRNKIRKNTNPVHNDIIINDENKKIKSNNLKYLIFPNNDLYIEASELLNRNIDLIEIDIDENITYNDNILIFFHTFLQLCLNKQYYKNNHLHENSFIISYDEINKNPQKIYYFIFDKISFESMSINIKKSFFFKNTCFLYNHIMKIKNNFFKELQDHFGKELENLVDIIKVDGNNGYYLMNYLNIHSDNINDDSFYDNTFINPFDVKINNNDQLKNLLLNNHLLFPKILNKNLFLNEKYSSYNNLDDNFYIQSRNLFLETIQMNHTTFKNTYENKYSCLLIYIYNIFYKITIDSTNNINEENYRLNLNHAKTNGIDILNTFWDYYKYFDNYDNKLFNVITTEDIKFSLTKKEINILDMIIYDIINEKIISERPVDILNNFKYPNGCRFVKGNKIEYDFNGQIYTNNKNLNKLDSHLILENKNDGTQIAFSDIYPKFKIIDNLTYALLDEPKYINYFNNPQISLPQNIPQFESKIQNEKEKFYFINKVEQNNNTNKLFRVYLDFFSYYDNNMFYYEYFENSKQNISLLSNKENIIIDENEFHTNFYLEKNISGEFVPYKYCFHALLTKNKLYLLFNDVHESLKQLKKNENIFGYDFKNDYNLKSIINKNIYFEYDTDYDIVSKKFINIKINDSEHAFILLLVLARSQSSYLIHKLMNNFLSFLNPNIICGLLNIPTSYLIAYKIREIYKLNDYYKHYPEKYNIIKEKFGSSNQELFAFFGNNVSIEKRMVKIIANSPQYFKYKEFENINRCKCLQKIEENCICNQKHCIDDILEKIRENINEKDNDKINNYLYEIMMGMGKSKVIIPYVCYEIIFNYNNNLQILIVAPDHLTEDMFKKISDIARGMPLCIVKKIESINDSCDYLAKMEKGILIISDSLLKLLMISDNKLVQNTKKEGAKIFEEKANNRILIIDEVDDCINPLKSNFNLRQEEGTIIKLNYILDFVIDFVIEIVNSQSEKKCTIFNNVIEKIGGAEKLYCCICREYECSHDISEEDCEFECDNTNVSYNFRGVGKKITKINKEDDLITKETTYVLKKLYDATSIIDSKKYIFNKNYGFGKDENKNTFYYTIPYEGIDIPSPDSEFNDIYLTLILTIYAYVNTNEEFFLNKKQENTKKWRDNDINDIITFFKNNKINIQVNNQLRTELIKKDKHIIKLLLKNESLETRELEYIKNIFNDHDDRNLMQILAKYYIKNIVVNKIQYIKSYINTSFLELLYPQAISKFNIGFTGTIDYIGKIKINNEENYPIIKNKPIFKLIDKYETLKLEINKSQQYFQNYTYCCFSENSDCSINTTCIYDFIKSENNKRNNNDGNIIKCIIDTAAIFRYKNNEKYAEEMLSKLDIDFVLYFDEYTHILMKKTKENQKSEKIIKITDLSTFKNLNDTTRIFKENKFILFFDNTHTRGTDIEDLPSIHALVTVSHINDKVNVLQGIYRLRKLGKDGNPDKQTCEFIVNNELKKDITKIKEKLTSTPTPTPTNMKNELYLYLEENTQKYMESQKTDLLIQTIYSNTKWKNNDQDQGKLIYDLKKIEIPIIPEEELKNETDVYKILYKNYVLDKKIIEYCKRNNNTYNNSDENNKLNEYCELINNIIFSEYCKNLKKYDNQQYHSESKSICKSEDKITHGLDVSSSKSQSISSSLSTGMSISTNKMGKTVLQYKTLLPIPTNCGFLNIYKLNKDGLSMNYLSICSYLNMYLSNEFSNEEIKLSNDIKTIKDYFIDENKISKHYSSYTQKQPIKYDKLQKIILDNQFEILVIPYMHKLIYKLLEQHHENENNLENLNVLELENYILQDNDIYSLISNIEYLKIIKDYIISILSNIKNSFKTFENFKNRFMSKNLNAYEFDLSDEETIKFILYCAIQFFEIKIKIKKSDLLLKKLNQNENINIISIKIEENDDIIHISENIKEELKYYYLTDHNSYIYDYDYSQIINNLIEDKNTSETDNLKIIKMFELETLIALKDKDELDDFFIKLIIIYNKNYIKEFILKDFDISKLMDNSANRIFLSRILIHEKNKRIKNNIIEFLNKHDNLPRTNNTISILINQYDNQIDKNNKNIFITNAIIDIMNIFNNDNNHYFENIKGYERNIITIFYYLLKRNIYLNYDNTTNIINFLNNQTNNDIAKSFYIYRYIIDVLKINKITTKNKLIIYRLICKINKDNDGVYCKIFDDKLNHIDICRNEECNSQNQYLYSDSDYDTDLDKNSDKNSYLNIFENFTKLFDNENIGLNLFEFYLKLLLPENMKLDKFYSFFHIKYMPLIEKYKIQYKKMIKDEQLFNSTPSNKLWLYIKEYFRTDLQENISIKNFEYFLYVYLIMFELITPKNNEIYDYISQNYYLIRKEIDKEEFEIQIEKERIIKKKIQPKTIEIQNKLDQLDKYFNEIEYTYSNVYDMSIIFDNSISFDNLDDIEKINYDSENLDLNKKIPLIRLTINKLREIEIKNENDVVQIIYILDKLYKSANSINNTIEIEKKIKEEKAKRDEEEKKQNEKERLDEIISQDDMDRLTKEESLIENLDELKKNINITKIKLTKLNEYFAKILINYNKDIMNTDIVFNNLDDVFKADYGSGSLDKKISLIKKAIDKLNQIINQINNKKELNKFDRCRKKILNSINLIENNIFTKKQEEEEAKKQEEEEEAKKQEELQKSPEQLQFIKSLHFYNLNLDSLEKSFKEILELYKKQIIDINYNISNFEDICPKKIDSFPSIDEKISFINKAIPKLKDLSTKLKDKSEINKYDRCIKFINSSLQSIKTVFKEPKNLQNNNQQEPTNQKDKETYLRYKRKNVNY